MTQPTRYYIAGPMSGIEEHNFPAFEAAENALRLKGLKVISPREITLAGEGKALDKPWNFYLRNDLSELLTCDALVLLSGWKASRGARLEYTIADKLEMWIFFLNSEMQLKRQNAGYRGV